MYSFVEPGCFHVPLSMQRGAIPPMHPTVSEYLGESCQGRGSEHRQGWGTHPKVGVDSDAGRLYAAVRSMLAVYEEMQAYHPRDVDRGLYICTGTEYRVVEAVGSSERTSRSSDTARTIDPDLASKR